MQVRVCACTRVVHMPVAHIDSSRVTPVGVSETKGFQISQKTWLHGQCIHSSLTPCAERFPANWRTLLNLCLFGCSQLVVAIEHVIIIIIVVVVGVVVIITITIIIIIIKELIRRWIMRRQLKARSLSVIRRHSLKFEPNANAKGGRGIYDAWNLRATSLIPLFDISSGSSA